MEKSYEMSVQLLGFGAYFDKKSTVAVMIFNFYFK